MRLNTDFVERCLRSLIASMEQLSTKEPDDVFYDIFRAACVKEFELILEQSNTLLRKRLRPYFASNREADQLNFKDVYRHSAKRGLMSVEECERWIRYRDIRNRTAHEYGEQYAEMAVQALPDFVADARRLVEVVAEPFDV